ncbi:MAG: AraC family transcriptional regulator, partial [Hydrogenophaga sp.]|uniref:AraC family transcriptional regulator n=1 Tax=Hydrogenophaga sp. TaxID=1904254 RepID=UPI00273338FD
MPQDRILYADTAAWRVERVVKRAAPVHASSAVYQAATPRWVFPVSGVSEFRLDGQPVLLDGLTVVVLPAGIPYQIHDWHAAPRSHMVVSMQPDSHLHSSPGGAQSWTLVPRALWELRLHWRALAQGCERTVLPERVLAEQVLALGSGAVHTSGNAHPAVARARRFMATRTAEADGQAWSLHDVADASCCSYFHLSRLFRAHTGLGLHAYRE